MYICPNFAQNLNKVSRNIFLCVEKTLSTLVKVSLNYGSWMNLQLKYMNFRAESEWISNDSKWEVVEFWKISKSKYYIKTVKWVYIYGTDLISSNSKRVCSDMLLKFGHRGLSVMLKFWMKFRKKYRVEISSKFYIFRYCLPPASSHLPLLWYSSMYLEPETTPLFKPNCAEKGNLSTLEKFFRGKNYIDFASVLNSVTNKD